jgi:hypothetical protein
MWSDIWLHISLKISSAARRPLMGWSGRALRQLVRFFV